MVIVTWDLYHDTPPDQPRCSLFLGATTHTTFSNFLVGLAFTNGVLYSAGSRSGF